MSHLRDSPPTPGTRLPLTYETRLTPGSPSVHARRFPAPGRSLIHQNDHADITVHPPVLPKKNVSSPPPSHSLNRRAASDGRGPRLEDRRGGLDRGDRGRGLARVHGHGV